MQRTALLLAFLVGLVPTFADTVLTKSGQRIDGKIINETPEFVTIEVPFSETIMEKRIIARADIAAVEKVASEDIAFKRLQATPDPDTALSPDAINAMLDGRLRPFVAEHPNFAQLPELKKRIEALEAEAERLEAGEVKLFGWWIPPGEQTAEKTQIEATRLFVAMQKSADNDAFGAVLNEFAILDARYSGTIAYVRAVPLAREAAEKLIGQLDFAISNVGLTLAERQQTLGRAGIADRAQVQAALDRQDAYAVTLADRARTTKQEFYQILAYDEKGLQTMRDAATKVLANLRKVDLAPLERAVPDVVRTNAFIADGNLAAARTTLARVEDNWPKYEGLGRLKLRITAEERTIADRKKAAEAAAEAAAKAAATSPKPTAKPAQ